MKRYKAIFLFVGIVVTTQFTRAQDSHQASDQKGSRPSASTLPNSNKLEQDIGLNITKLWLEMRAYEVNHGDETLKLISKQEEPAPTFLKDKFSNSEIGDYRLGAVISSGLGAGSGLVGVSLLSPAYPYATVGKARSAQLSAILAISVGAGLCKSAWDLETFAQKMEATKIPDTERTIQWDKDHQKQLADLECKAGNNLISATNALAKLLDWDEQKKDTFKGLMIRAAKKKENKTLLDILVENPDLTSPGHIQALKDMSKIMEQQSKVAAVLNETDRSKKQSSENLELFQSVASKLGPIQERYRKLNSVENNLSGDAKKEAALVLQHATKLREELDAYLIFHSEAMSTP